MNKVNLTEKAKKYMTMNPTKIGVVLGITFYEHPIYGDESPLYYIDKNGDWKSSDFYDMPDYWEVFYSDIL